MNLTKSQDLVQISTQNTPTLDHVASTEIHSIHNMYSHLGYGDCKYNVFFDKIVQVDVKKL